MIENEKSTAINEIVRKGWNLLVDNMGEADATRFIVSFERGKGDSVQEIKKFWGDKKVEEIHREVLEAKKRGCFRLNSPLVAVKIIDTRGIEGLKILPIE
ncbi:MAG: hypothetical protein E3K40_14870 [Candidatus Brocadia sp.]|nr:hypothetical protein [Candidatus Brocadia sp.]MDG6027953.1 hypothetical protein [Candidatus Brocadia sp.]